MKEELTEKDRLLQVAQQEASHFRARNVALSRALDVITAKKEERRKKRRLEASAPSQE